MSDVQHSWSDGCVNNGVWIEDPDRHTSHQLSHSSGPSHISASIVSSSYDTPSSVPPTEPQTSTDGTPINGSVESGRATRAAGDGVWRLPDGSWHPRNIYSDSSDDDYDNAASHRPIV